MSSTIRMASKSTHFGFESVTTDEKSHKVNQVFTSVAPNYDLMNDVMSLGIHRYWKRELIRKLDPMKGTVLLDMCGGTGDIGQEFVTHMRHRFPNDNQFKVIVCDINQQMLKVGQNRAKLRLSASACDRMEWVSGDAMELPFEDNRFDAYTVGFGIRNVVDIEKALSEAHRVLRRGAMFACLEFSQLQNPLLSKLYDFYSFEMIPVLGEVFAKDWKSYQYLVESIRQFPDQKEFQSMIESAGFGFVEYTNFFGGIAAIHCAYKK